MGLSSARPDPGAGCRGGVHYFAHSCRHHGLNTERSGEIRLVDAGVPALDGNSMVRNVLAADLRGAHLAGANLRGAILHAADLSEADWFGGDALTAAEDLLNFMRGHWFVEIIDAT